MAITLRNVKGSELTFEELDGNFTDLNGRVTTLEGSTGLSNVVEDTTPELGGDLVTGTNRLKFSSAGGSMLDFTVTQYSVANNTVLSSVGSINLFLDSASADASGDTAFRIFDTTNPDGTFNENTNIFKIADNGNVTVTGNISVSGTNQIQLGAAQDLSIFHNGGHSIIRETGTGSLYLQSDDNVILSTDSGTKKMVKGVGSGEVILYHNDVQKLNTSTSGVTVVDEVHTEGATPHLTLKRTDNANVPTLRFKGSGGTIGASIDFDGTAGTSNELAFQTYDGATIAERFRVTYTGVKVTGRIDIGGSLGIGQNAARTNQGIDAVAVGGIAGDDAQGDKAVAVGASAGQLDQGAGAVALGFGAGQNLQAANSIVINATGNVLQNTTASSTVIKPIRNASGTHALEYNPTTGEVTYDTLPAGGGSQNLFSTIASAGQNNIVADGTTDTLYIEAGTGISIATDQNTDTLTITATGAGAQTLDDVVTLGNSTNSAVTINNTLTVNSVQSTGVGFATMTSATDIILNPAGEVSVSNSKISNVSDPTQPTQAATKNYVDTYAVLLATLKTEVAASTSFADFQSRIAAL